MPPPAVVSFTYQDGHAVVLDACGLPHTAADLEQTIHLLEGRHAAEAPEYRRFWAQAIAWRRRLLAALDALEAADAA